MDIVARRLAVLGSTGSIGRQTLDVVRSLPGRFQVVALSAGQNLQLLKKQVEEFHPQFVSYKKTSARDRSVIAAECISMEEIASCPVVDAVVVATSGRAGLLSTLCAVREGKNVAIANKEPLVMAGGIITSEAEIHNASILPIDSEHSAIWQCLTGEMQKPEKIILTASGGPFRTYTKARLRKVTPAEAMNHPSWKMGKKVTIDSATLMNKGLEVIEAHWLFGMPIGDIRVLVHPQSIIHSMIEFADASVKAQMAYPDMRLPIQYALTHPERLPNPTLPRIAWDEIKELTFEQPDPEKFPCLRLATEAGESGGTMPAVLCAADEVAVDLFLKEKIDFMDIPAIIAACLDKHESIHEPPLEVILEADSWARNYATKLARKKSK